MRYKNYLEISSDIDGLQFPIFCGSDADADEPLEEGLLALVGVPQGVLAVVDAVERVPRVDVGVPVDVDVAIGKSLQLADLLEQRVAAHDEEQVGATPGREPGEQFATGQKVAERDDHWISK